MNACLRPLFGLGVSLGLVVAVVPLSRADTLWIGAVSGTYSTAGNWNNGLPSTGPQLAIFDGNYPNRVIDITATPRNCVGIRFDLAPGDNGFTFWSSATTTANIGMQSRAGGSVNGILNNDDSTQTFNVPVRLFTSAGGSGAGAAQTFNAAAGPLVFSGIYPAASTNATVFNGGGTLTIAGAFDTTIGLPGGRGNIIGAGGLTKIGAGTLTLGGTLPNTYTGPTTITEGRVVAAKDNAFGSLSALILNGGILDTGGFDHSFGTLDLNANSVLDFGSGSSDLVFADSDSQDWDSFTLTIRNWTPGQDTFRVGTDGVGFDAQLALLRFEDFGNAPGMIDPNGYIVPVPEPAPTVLGLSGALALLLGARRRR